MPILGTALKASAWFTTRLRRGGTGIGEIRAAMDAVSHPALLLVDAVSSLAVMGCRHDGWGVDVASAVPKKD